MSIRKLLGNSSPKFWESLSVLVILGDYPALFSVALFIYVMPTIVLKVLGFVLWLAFCYLYFGFGFFVISMAAPDYRPVFFRPGDRITPRLSRDEDYIVIRSSGFNHAWVKTPQGVKILVDSGWCFYDSTQFERLLQNRLERMIHCDGLTYSMAAQIYFSN